MKRMFLMLTLVGVLGSISAGSSATLPIYGWKYESPSNRPQDRLQVGAASQSRPEFATPKGLVMPYPGTGAVK